MRLPRSLRGAAWLSLSQLAFVASGYLLNLVLGRTLGPVDFGVYSVVITILSVVNLTQTQGVPQGLARAVAAEPERAGALFATTARIGRLGTAAGMVALLLLAPVVAVAFDDVRFGVGLLIAALAVPGYAAVAVWTGFLNGTKAFRRQAAWLTWYSALRVLVVLGLAWAFGVYGAVAGFAVVPLLVVALLGRAAPRRRPGERPAPWRPLVRFGAASVGFSLAVTGIMSVDLLLVEGIVADDASTGRYAAAQNMARITYFLLLPAGAVLFPAVATTVAGADPLRLRTVVADGIEGAAALAVPVCAVVAGAGDELLELVFGSAYAGAGDVLVLLGPALGLLSVAATLGAVIRGAGHGRSPMLVALAALGCGLLAGVPLTAVFDARGAAAATLLAATLCLVGQGVLVARLVGSFLDVRRLAIVVAAGAACFAVAAQATSPLAAVPIVPAALLLDAALVVAFRAVPRVLRRAGA